MADTIILDVWDKLAIIAAAMIVIFMVLVCVVCIVSPVFCLNRYCPCRDIRGQEKLIPVYGAIEYGSDVELQSVKMVPRSSDQGRTSYWPQLGAIKESDASDGFSDTGTERIEMKKNKSRRQSTRSSDSGSSLASSFAHHNATLSFTLTFDSAASILYVHVKQLAGFKLSDPDGAMAPYIKVRLYRSPKPFFTFRSKSGRELMLNNMDVETQTKIQRRTDDPVFNETFPLALEQKDLGHCCLRFLVCDFDRYQRHVVVGEIVVDISRVEWPPEMKVYFCEHLHPPIEEELGQIHIGLMYLPTSQKLNLFILSAQGLKVVDPHKQSAECYVKVMLLHDGRPMKKCKTSIQINDVSPLFNESFTFDVPNEQLEKVYLSLTVLHVDKVGKRHLVGRSYIGRNFDTYAREQWQEMMQSPRKQVTCWHRLQS